MGLSSPASATHSHYVPSAGLPTEAQCSPTDPAVKAGSALLPVTTEDTVTHSRWGVRAAERASSHHNWASPSQTIALGSECGQAGLTDTPRGRPWRPQGQTLHLLPGSGLREKNGQAHGSRPHLGLPATPEPGHRTAESCSPQGPGRFPAPRTPLTQSRGAQSVSPAPHSSPPQRSRRTPYSSSLTVPEIPSLGFSC